MNKKTPSFSVNSYAEIFTSPIFKNQNGEWFKEVNYQDTVDLIRENIQSAAASVIAIGYYLKHLNKDGLFREGGYDSIWECAEQECGISQSTASRYMDMNDIYSVNSDSPILDDKYKDFNKGQLQEMLYLPAETRDQVIENISPEETVKDIRTIVSKEKAKQEPKEEDILAVYKNMIKGKYSGLRSDLKNYLSEHCKNVGYHSEEFYYRGSSRGIKINDYNEITWHRYVQLLNEYLPEPAKSGSEETYSEQKFATSQIFNTNQLPGQMEIQDYPEVLPEQKEEKEIPARQEKDSEVFHFIDANRGVEDAYGATRATIVREYLSLIHEEKVETIYERYSVTFKALGKEYTAKIATDKNKVMFYDSSDRAFMDVESVRLQKEYEYWYPKVLSRQSDEFQKHCPHEHDGCNRHWCVDMECMDYEHCCADCPVPCNGKCGWIKENGWERDDSQVINVEVEPWEEKEPEEIKHYENPIPQIEDEMLQHGKSKKEYDPSLQPDLPTLKNKDQREEFLGNYKSWPVWIRIEETGETYYRYNLFDGTSIVIRHCIRKAEWRNEEYDWEEKFLLQSEKYFKDCETNTTTLIEHLKNVQKNGG